MDIQRKIRNIVFSFLIIGSGRKIILEHRRLNNMLHKQEMALRTYEMWMKATQEKRSIAEFLERNNCREVAIYGLGRLGRQLYEEIKASSIEIAYVIDRNYSFEHLSYKESRCYHPEDRLPKVELMIVAVSSEANQIISDMRQRVTCSIKAIDDILNLMNRTYLER